MYVRTNSRNGSWLRCALAACTIAAFTASCGSSTDVQDHSEVGSYGLITVNGQSLPVTLTSTSLGTVVVDGGTLTLTANGTGTYTANVTGSVTDGQGSAPILFDLGSYDRSGSTLTFHSSAAPFSYSGTYDHDTGSIIVSLPGLVIGVAGTIELGLAPQLQ
jgi:hypothetical protein